MPTRKHSAERTALVKLMEAARAVEAGEYRSALLAELMKGRDEMEQLARVFDSVARNVTARDRQLKMLRVVIPMGVALSAEKNFNRLLETVVVESQKLTNATANLSSLLAMEGFRFGVVDTDIASPGIHVLFNFDESEMVHSLNTRTR